MCIVNLMIFLYCVGIVIVICLLLILIIGFIMSDLNDLIDIVWK